MPTSNGAISLHRKLKRRCWFAFHLLVLLGPLVLTTGCSSLLYYPTRGIYYPPEKQEEKNTPKEVWWENSEGQRLHGWHFSAKVARKGLIVFFHGNAENLSSHYLHLAWIPRFGYDYIIWDYQGFGESTGNPTPENTVKDATLVMRSIAKENPGVPLFLFAQSLGGAIALRTVADLKGQIPLKGLIVDSTFYSYQSVGRAVLAQTWFTWPFQWLPYLLLSDSFAPGDRISEISPIPLLVIHGTEDRNVAYFLGEKIFQLAKEPKEFWTVEGGGHTDFLWRDKGLYRDKLLAYLAKLL